MLCSVSQSSGVNVLHSLSISDSLGAISLPRCIVPRLEVYPEITMCDECHLKVPYERKIVIANVSHVPGCYGLIPQVWHRIHLLLSSIIEEIIRGEKTLDNTLLVSIQS